MAETDPRKETWDRYWKSDSPQYGRHDILLGHILEHVNSRGDIIMEIGAGSGVDALELAGRGYRVMVTDISRESLKLIKTKSKESDIDLTAVMADALHLPFKPGSIDFIYHQGLLEHFKDPHPLLAESKIVLKRGGKILADVPQTFTIYTLKKKWAMARGNWFAGWETQYTPGRLRRILKKAGFRPLACYGRDYDFRPLIWMRDIVTLGRTRFGRPIIPGFISKPVSVVWSLFERSRVSNYIMHSIGAVAIKNEDSD